MPLTQHSGNLAKNDVFIFSGHEKRAKIMLLRERFKKSTKLFVSKPFLIGKMSLIYQIFVKEHDSGRHYLDIVVPS